MIMEFLVSQITRAIEHGIDRVGNHAAENVKNSRERVLIEEKARLLEQKYAGTVVDTDRFQRCYTYHEFDQRIRDYFWYPELRSQSEEELLNGLVQEYDQSCSKENGERSSSDDKRLLYGFLQNVSDLYREAVFGRLDDHDRALLAAQSVTVLPERQPDRHPDGHPKYIPSRSAVIFQKKFHKRLFLENEDGAELAQVYITPVCKNGNRGAEDAFDAVTDFLKSPNLDLMVIEGVAGSGKSSFVAALSERCASPEYLYVSLKIVIFVRPL